MASKMSILLNAFVGLTKCPSKVQYTGNSVPIMVSYRLFSLFGWSFKLHRFITSDAPECFHAHAGKSLRMVLSGEYLEEIYEMVPPFGYMLEEGLDQTRRDILRNDSKSLHLAKSKARKFSSNMRHIFEFYSTIIDTSKFTVKEKDQVYTDGIIRRYARIKRFRPSKIDANFVHRVQSVASDTWSLWITKNKNQKPIVLVGDGWL